MVTSSSLWCMELWEILTWQRMRNYWNDPWLFWLVMVSPWCTCQRSHGRLTENTVLRWSYTRVTGRRREMAEWVETPWWLFYRMWQTSWLGHHGIWHLPMLSKFLILFWIVCRNKTANTLILCVFFSWCLSVDQKLPIWKRFLCIENLIRWVERINLTSERICFWFVRIWHLKLYKVP